MEILLTNDDGIHAEGLVALAEAVSGIARVFVVAPEEQMSGTGHSITTEGVLRAESVGDDRYSVNGTPADCVRMGLLTICPDAAWVMSGINYGANLGVDVWMSGTVAAAREAALLGRPAIAWSQFFRDPQRTDWPEAARSALELFAELQSEPLAAGSFYNVNFGDPADLATESGWVRAPLDSHPLPVRYEADESGGWHYRCDYQQRPRGEGSDVDLCFKGRTTVTELAAANHAQSMQ